MEFLGIQMADLKAIYISKYIYNAFMQSQADTSADNIVREKNTPWTLASLSTVREELQTFRNREGGEK